MRVFTVSPLFCAIRAFLFVSSASRSGSSFLRGDRGLLLKILKGRPVSACKHDEQQRLQGEPRKWNQGKRRFPFCNNRVFEHGPAVWVHNELMKMTPVQERPFETVVHEQPVLANFQPAPLPKERQEQEQELDLEGFTGTGNWRTLDFSHLNPRWRDRPEIGGIRVPEKKLRRCGGYPEALGKKYSFHNHKLRLTCALESQFSHPSKCEILCCQR